MYNEEIKLKFIREEVENQITRQVYLSVFNATEKYEEQWGADLCTKSTEELQPVVNKIVGLQNRSKYSRLRALNTYVKWCLRNSIPGACDGMLNIKEIGLDTVREKMVSNPKHLQNYLDAICEPAEKQGTDNIYRCYYWLAYAGIEEEDILDIKCSDVDFRNMIVEYKKKGTFVQIYSESLTAFHNCVELKQFVNIHPNYSKETWRDRVDGDTLIRGVRGILSTKAIRTELSRRSKKKSDNTNLKLSYKRVFRSGLFFRMYMDESAGNAVDFYPIVLQNMEGKEYDLSSGRNTIEAKQRQLVRDLEEDYSRWKLAFYN